MWINSNAASLIHQKQGVMRFPKFFVRYTPWGYHSAVNCTDIGDQILPVKYTRLIRCFALAGPVDRPKTPPKTFHAYFSAFKKRSDFKALKLFLDKNAPPQNFFLTPITGSIIILTDGASKGQAPKTGGHRGSGARELKDGAGKMDD